MHDVAIMGSELTNYTNAYELLEDRLDADGCEVTIPNYALSNSEKLVKQVLDELDITYTSVRRSKILEQLKQHKSSQLIVIGTEGLSEEINYCLTHGIYVLDLTKGLYQVHMLPEASADIPLYGSESDADGLTEESGTSVSLPAAQPLTELLGKQVIVWLDEDSPQVVQRGKFLGFGDGGDIELLGHDGLVYHAWPLLKIKEDKELRAHVATTETGFGPAHVEQEIVTPETLPEVTEVPKQKYYKSKSGKLRKADGRTKKRPTEDEVMLTSAEAATFGG